MLDGISISKSLGMPFESKTIVKPETDGKMPITVYRKPTHMDQYLQWDNHQHLSAKYSVISILTHSNPELLQKEMEHLMKALTNCK